MSEVIVTGDSQVRNSSASFGTWRIKINNNDDMIFQRHEGRSWITKHTISGG